MIPSARFIRGVVLLAVLGLGGSRAHATNYWKNSVVTGSWSTGANWSATSAAGVDNAGAPTPGEDVNIAFNDGAARTVTYDVAAPTIGILAIDLTGPGATTATLTLPGTIDLPTGGIAVGGYNGAGLTVGRGALIQSGGTTSIIPNKDLLVGWRAGSTGVYTLSGGALVANLNEYVGFSGTGTFNQSGGSNTINASGTGFFSAGHNAGATGTYNLSGTGALSTATDQYIGYAGAGTFNQTGGTNTISGVGRHLYLGFGASGSGTYTISGTAALTAGGNVVVGNNGTGTLTIQDQASVYVTNQLLINNLSTVHLNGGTLRFGTIGGISRLNYASGTIQLAGDRNIGPDATIDDLFGPNAAYPFANVIPGGKRLRIEGFARSKNQFIIDSGHVEAYGFSVENGGSGSNTMTIVNGGTLTTGSSSIGYGLGSDPLLFGSASVRGPGSSWTADALLLGRDLEIDAEFSDYFSTLNIEDQGLVDLGQLRLFGQGILNLNGGTLRLDRFERIVYPQYNIGQVHFNAGTIQFVGDRLVGADESMSALVGAAPTMTSGKGVTVEGTATLLATVTIDGGAFTVGRLVNGHHLQFRRGTLNITNQSLTIGSGETLGDAIDVDDDQTLNVTLGMTNQGLVTGDGTIGGSFHNAAGGQLRAQPGRSLALTGAGNTNDGQINLFGGELDFTQDLTNNAGAFISGNGSLISGGLTNNGTMNFAGTANIVGDVMNSVGGKVISGGGGATIFYDDVTNDGEIRTSTNGFTVFFGAVDGAGAFTGTGTVNFEGDLSPGNSPAAVQFAGDVVLGPAALLDIELGGATPGAQYDQVIVAGELSLGGDLAISLINGFSPSGGQSFNILDWGSLSGAFASLTLPALGGGLTWNASQLYTTGVLSVAPAFTADFDKDGDVDAADLAQWTGDFGLTGDSDADADGDSDGADFLAWQRQLGSESAVAATAAVPEPGALLLFIVASAGICSLGRSRRKWRLSADFADGRGWI